LSIGQAKENFCFPLDFFLVKNSVDSTGVLPGTPGRQAGSKSEVHLALKIEF
jgi:hypothetical protein